MMPEPQYRQMQPGHQRQRSCPAAALPARPGPRESPGSACPAWLGVYALGTDAGRTREEPGARAHYVAPERVRPHNSGGGGKFRQTPTAQPYLISHGFTVLLANGYGGYIPGGSIGVGLPETEVRGRSSKGVAVMTRASMVGMALVAVCQLSGPRLAADEPKAAKPDADSSLLTTPLQLAFSPKKQVFGDNFRVAGLSLSCLGNRNRANHGLSLSLCTLSDTAGAIAGVELSGVGLAKRPMSGIQSSFVCSTGTNIKGLQLSGGVCRAANVKGAQLAGQVSLATTVRGLQLGTACQADGIQGVQIGPAVCLANAMEGAQVGMACLCSTLTGAQIGGFVSETDRVTGVQVAGLVAAAAKSCDGLQIAPVTYAKLMTGVQIGLLNYCTDLQGVQIGLLNISWYHPNPVLPILNVRF